MHRLVSLVRLALVVGVACSVGGCGQIEKLRAKSHFKEANTFYQQQDYRRAAEAYEEAIKADPELTAAYFYLGNSYDNQYRPSRQGEPENDALLEKALANYRLAVERETDPAMKKLSLEYLVAAYGPDKLNDPEQAEPLVLEMIALEPGEATNYFALAKIYEDAGRYDEAEEMLVKAKDNRPADPAVYMQLAGFYNRQGDFEKTIEALEMRAEREPNNPEAFYTIATYYWDKAYRDFRLAEPDKAKYAAAGLVAVDRAIEINPDYMEAVTYRGLLLRVQAALEKDAARQKALLKEAEAMQARAIELRKIKAAGVGD
ncbi:MAG: tetratricopeptide repeat protein [Acidobacteria bacterium]|nr:tetratricopeptide repeat protein [Acidobacteriota bacterium]